MKGTSFKKIHGYPNLLLNRSWIRLTLWTAPSTSSFLANITIVALALRTFKGLPALQSDGAWFLGTYSLGLEVNLLLRFEIDVTRPYSW